MTIETGIEFLSWVVTICLLMVFVPRAKIRDAILIFLFKQFLTWPLGLLAVEFRLIKYPVRLLKIASQTSFTFEFFVYPALCVLFNLYYPVDRSLYRKAFHYFAFCTGITIFEVLLEKYTLLIEYIHWSWQVTWVSLFITFMISRAFYLWFFKLEKSGDYKFAR